MKTKSIIKCVAHKRPLTQGCSECLSPDAWDVFDDEPIIECHYCAMDGTWNVPAVAFTKSEGMPVVVKDHEGNVIETLQRVWWDPTCQTCATLNEKSV